ncbi:MAG: nucleotide exchange factor GrpE [Chitinophagales bacterium]
MEEKELNQNQVSVDSESSSPLDDKNEPSELELLQQSLETEKARADEYHNKYLRVLADADNQRKRWQKEKEEMFRYASFSLLRKLLPVLDDFHRARAAALAAKDEASLLKGIEMIEKRFAEIIAQEGATAIPALGETFDPQKHEALMVEETEVHPEGTILQELQAGYMLGERVLRPSLVKVAKPPEGSS